MWGIKVAKSMYQVKNVPFFAYKISYNDIVSAKEVAENIVEFQRVHKRSGHSTYRVFLYQDATENDFQRLWKKIEKLGGTYERATESLYGIDLPPTVDVHKVYKFLEEGENKKIWHFEEGHYGQGNVS